MAGIARGFGTRVIIHPVLETVLAQAPCDVAVHVGRGEPPRLTQYWRLTVDPTVARLSFQEAAAVLEAELAEAVRHQPRAATNSLTEEAM